MTITVISLGGPVAPEAEALLRAAGIASIATEPYPTKERMVALSRSTGRRR